MADINNKYFHEICVTSQLARLLSAAQNKGHYNMPYAQCRRLEKTYLSNEYQDHVHVLPTDFLLFYKQIFETLAISNFTTEDYHYHLFYEKRIGSDYIKKQEDECIQAKGTIIAGMRITQYNEYVSMQIDFCEDHFKISNVELESFKEMTGLSSTFDIDALPNQEL